MRCINMTITLIIFHEEEQQKYCSIVADADIEAEPMADYRIYLMVAGRIRAREDFKADNDIDAIRIAQTLCDACSDSCNSFDLWQGERKVDPPQGFQPVSFAELTQAHQQIVVETEETLVESDWTIAQSKRLIERI